MMVNGPLEIYSVVIGFKQFDEMFNILASMGVIFLPILVMLFQGITIPFESQMENGASTSLRQVGIKFFSWVFIIMICVVPTHRLDITSVSYQPPCEKGAVPSVFGDTGTTYDTVMGKQTYDNVRLPLMMSLVVYGMAGFTSAAISSLSCEMDVANIDKVSNVINTTQLPEPIANEAKQFERECFAPAKAKFNSEKPASSEYASTMKAYGGQSDLAWIGSHVMQQLYYSGLYPKNPVTDFPYESYPSHYDGFNKKQGFLVTPKWGYPDCGTWWTDPDHGLQAKLVNLAEKHTPVNVHLSPVQSLTSQLNRVLQYLRGGAALGRSVEPADVIAHNMLYQPDSAGAWSFRPHDISGGLDLTNGDTFSNPLSGMPQFHGMHWGSFIAGAGQHLAQPGSIFKREEIENEIPIIQAILIALVLALGPLIILIGMLTINAAIRVIFTYYFLVGSLFFMTFIERFLRYLELSLHASQSGNIYNFGSSAVLYNVFTKLYLYAPMLYLMLMSIAGISLGGAVQHSFGDTVAGESKRVAGMARKAASLARFL